MAGVAGLVVVLLLCAVGAVTGIMMLRRDTTPAANPVPVQTPPSPSPPITGAACLLGEWEEMSWVGTVTVYGVQVRITGKGTRMRLGPDTMISIADNIVYAGTAGGRRYEAIQDGTVTVTYQVVGTTLHYSDPRAEGTSIWKRDGVVLTTDPMEAVTTPETFSCSGNDLRITGEYYEVVYRRMGGI